jgi:CRP-like cAMP-binding protein
MLLVKQKVKTSLPMIKIKADTIIFEEGWDDYKMFFIVEGSVQLYHYDAENNVETDIEVIKINQFFGEIEMYSKRPRPVSAKILTDVVLVAIRTPLELEQFTNENRWLMGDIMQSMGEKLSVANSLLVAKLASELPIAQPEPVLEAVKDSGSIRRVIRH